MANTELTKYKLQLRERFKKIAPIFAKAAIGDFSHDVDIPSDKEDPQLAEFFVGIQIILDAIREKEVESEAALIRLHLTKLEVEHEKAVYQAILTSVAEGLIVVDRKAHITLMNQAAAFMLGVDRDKVIGANYYDVVVTKDKDDQVVPVEKRPLKQAVSEGKMRITTLNDGLHYIRSDGSAIPVAVTASPVVLGKDIIGGVSTFRDISEEKQLDRTKSEIISVASHQLRTPLTAVKWMSEELVAHNYALPKVKQKRYLRQIHNSNERMLALINDLLNVSRIELGTLSFKAQSFELNVLLNEVLKDVTALSHRKHVRLEKHVSKSLETVVTDPRYLRAILQNLLTNAIKYSPKGKRIITKIEHHQDGLFIAIKDEGYGIPAWQQNRIFGKLFRADNALKVDTDGTGLGLYVSKAMAEQAGGKIWFESVENQGTTFYVTIPLGAEAKPTKPVAS